MNCGDQIPIRLTRTGPDAGANLFLYPIGEAFCRKIDADEALSAGEAEWQIQEGGEYEYALPNGWHFRRHVVVSPSVRTASEGRIRPGNYVGRLVLEVEDDTRGLVGVVELESTSVKLDYRTDYQRMLNDLAAKSAELLMSSDEPVLQMFTVDPMADTETLYQRFVFAKALLSSEQLESALVRIFAAPTKAVRSMRVMHPTATIGHMGSCHLRQFATSGHRDSLPSSHWMAQNFGWSSVPHEMLTSIHSETVDVPENQFVKFVLESFVMFLCDMAKHENSSASLRAEAAALARRIQSHIDEPLFRAVSRLTRLPLSSPTLQRREGYREILKIWLMFGCASKLAWNGGHDVYRGGKRNIAALYEYWAFFKLLDVVASVFDFPEMEFTKLLSPSRNGLELSLQQGCSTTFNGQFAPPDGSRPLSVQFTYNKTFRHKDNLDEQGSWTVDMRPDYTLSIWPSSFRKVDDAEKVGAIVHIHFDAKYRIDKLVERTDSGAQPGSELAAEDADGDALKSSWRGLFKREDLLKMHAYNDAIRRTYGSYILYPGDKDDVMLRYREILPGLGAFILKPGDQKETDLSTIEAFIRRVVRSIQNRASQRERMAVYGYRVLRSVPAELTKVARNIVLPDVNGRGESFVPAEEPLIVAYCRPGEIERIESDGYRFRLGLERGELSITSEMLRADYILLHSGTDGAGKFFRMDRHLKPRLTILQDCQDFKNKTTNERACLSFQLIPIGQGEPLSGVKCNVARLLRSVGESAEVGLFAITFQDLLLSM